MQGERIVRDVNAKFDEIPDEDRLTFAWALDEWMELSKMRRANRRRYSAMMHRLAFVVLSLSPACYRLLRFVLALPRADWVRVTQEERSMEIEGAMTDLGEGPSFLANYRERHGIASGCPKVILGLDATSLKKTGVVLAKPQEGVTAFLMPLDHDLPNVIVLLHPTAKMKVDPAVESIKEQLLVIISAAGFDRVGVAADGDPGTNAWHKALEVVYQDLPADVTLDRVIEALEARERVRTRRLGNGRDGHDTLKRLRCRLLKCRENGKALEGRHWRIDPEQVARLGEIVKTGRPRAVPGRAGT
jgi:hypothetical protein